MKSYTMIQTLECHWRTIHSSNSSRTAIPLERCSSQQTKNSLLIVSLRRHFGKMSALILPWVENANHTDTWTSKKTPLDQHGTTRRNIETQRTRSSSQSQTLLATTKLSETKECSNSRKRSLQHSSTDRWLADRSERRSWDLSRRKTSETGATHHYWPSSSTQQVDSTIGISLASRQTFNAR